MWLMTTFGYFSIVRKPWDKGRGTLTVRARALEDLDAFRLRCPELGPTKEDARADYRFRAQAPTAAVADCVAEAVTTVQYDNFKAAVGRTDPTRAHVYARVWGALLEVQRPSRATHPSLFRDVAPATRKAMQANRGTDTRPELALRAALRRARLPRGTANDRTLPGTPDLAYRRLKVAVFVDGEFWHGRLPAPKTRTDYWTEKFAANRRRDARVNRRLRAAGFRVVRLWAQDVIRRPERCVARVAQALEAARLTR